VSLAPSPPAMRDAWVRCMRMALEQSELEPSLHSFLDEKLGELATFLQNQA